MRIFAVGWNYRAHAEELNPNSIVPEPVVFMKPDTALLRENKPFFLPDFSQQVEYEAELVVRISKMGKYISPQFASRYYDALALGVDFTARDLQRECKEKGAPWEIAKGFDNSAPVSEFIPKEELDMSDIRFSLFRNGERVQEGFSSDMVYGIDELIAYISRFFTLKMGDLIFTGTPVGVGQVFVGDRLEGYIGERKMLDFRVC